MKYPTSKQHKKSEKHFMLEPLRANAKSAASTATRPRIVRKAVHRRRQTMIITTRPIRVGTIKVIIPRTTRVVEDVETVDVDAETEADAVAEAREIEDATVVEARNILPTIAQEGGKH